MLDLAVQILAKVSAQTLVFRAEALHFKAQAPVGCSQVSLGGKRKGMPPIRGLKASLVFGLVQWLRGADSNGENRV